MAVRFSLPPSFRSFWIRPPVRFPAHVQRSCGHYETLEVTAERGVYDRLLGERLLLCCACRQEHMIIAQLAYAPRLRLHNAQGIWGVERLLASARGSAFQVVAWLSSREDCLEWIRNTFAGRPYEIVEEIE